MSSLCLKIPERKELLAHYRQGTASDTRLRAHILLLLDAGHSWATISAVLFCSLTPSAVGKPDTRSMALMPFSAGTEAASGRASTSGRPLWSAGYWWVLALSPADFRFVRGQWSCEAVAVVLRDDYGVPVGRETVRLWLRADGRVWRWPRPTIRPKDPDRAAKLRALRELLNNLPADETAVFMDEADVNLNPKVGCMWMRRGEQATVETPGTNQKRYLAGSIHWRTGRVILTEGRPKAGRGAALFCRHLDELRRAFRHYRVVHVICDNARFHKPDKSKVVKEYLAEWSGQVVLHYLPNYSPDCNPVERVWWRLHDAVTRNHRCQTMQELLDRTLDWFETRIHFHVPTSMYAKTAQI